MKALKRITSTAAMVVAIALAAAACGTPTVTMADGQQAPAPQTQEISEATRVQAYCALESTAAETLKAFRDGRTWRPSPSRVHDAATLAKSLTEVAPEQIVDSLQVHLTALRQLDRAFRIGTYDVMAFHRPMPRDATKRVAFADAAAAIAAFDAEVCGF